MDADIHLLLGLYNFGFQVSWDHPPSGKDEGNRKWCEELVCREHEGSRCRGQTFHLCSAGSGSRSRSPELHWPSWWSSGSADTLNSHWGKGSDRGGGGAKTNIRALRWRGWVWVQQPSLWSWLQERICIWRSSHRTCWRWLLLQKQRRPLDIIIQKAQWEEPHNVRGDQTTSGGFRGSHPEKKYHRPLHQASRRSLASFSASVVPWARRQEQSHRWTWDNAGRKSLPSAWHHSILMLCVHFGINRMFHFTCVTNTKENLTTSAHLQLLHYIITGHTAIKWNINIE